MPDDRLRKHYAHFEEDIEELGAYRYTDASLLSARMANERYTEMILSSADFSEKSVVDVGSGDGTYSAELARLSGAGHVLAVEPSAKATARAQLTYAGAFSNLEFVCATSQDLLSDGRRFDVAVYRGVIHHVGDPRGELIRAVSLAETIVILEPNGLNPGVKLLEAVSDYHRRHRERSFAPSRLARWISEGGGAVEAVRFFGLVPCFSPAIVARVGRALESAVELIPILRAVCCGQYVMVALGRPRSNSL